jgi:hypothetical protein
MRASIMRPSHAAVQTEEATVRNDSDNENQACDASLFNEAGAQHSQSPMIAVVGAVIVSPYTPMMDQYVHLCT